MEELTIETRIGALPAGAALKGDRFAALASALVSASVLSAAPNLLAASNDMGLSVVGFRPAVTSASLRERSGPAMDGDLSLSFLFR